jgi:hypothetical protein
VFANQPEKLHSPAFVSCAAGSARLTPCGGGREKKFFPEGEEKKKGEEKKGKIN